MTSFSRVLAETAPRIGPALSPLHFRYFCDKLAVSFCPRFYETIFRRAPLSPHHALPHSKHSCTSKPHLPGLWTATC